MNTRGWGYLLGIIVNRVIPEWFFRFRRSNIYQLDLLDRMGCNPPTSIQYRWISDAKERDELHNLTGNVGEPMGNHRAAGAFAEDELVGGVWLAPSEFVEQELGYQMILPESGYWLYSASIRKNLRNQGIYSGLLKFVLADIAPHTVWAAVNPFNRPSRAVHDRRGRVVGSVIAMRLFPVTLCWTTGQLRRDSTFTWNAYHRPVRVAVPEPEPRTRS